MSQRYNETMRTTIRMKDSVLRAARKAAVERDISLTRFIEEAVAKELAGAHTQRPTRAPQIVTFAGDGILPGVDLDDSAALLETMDG